MNKIILEYYDLIGNVIEATGATTAAVGYTRQAFINNELQNGSLIIAGNTLQGIGNTILAEVETEDFYSKLGSSIQAGGAFTGAAGEGISLFLNEEEEGIRIGILGNSLQALGSGVTALGRISNLKKTIGNEIQGLGNIIEAIGGLIDVRTDTAAAGLIFYIPGAWLQSIGTIFQTAGAYEDFIKLLEKEARKQKKSLPSVSAERHGIHFFRNYVPDP
ncbi:hypothetical protein GJU40_05115 [Bacillus lacus]|uniref:Uncharacterized protein n=1 Tax=Metabacillus lacus TaxID=1983721 RepID=A0A7X2LWJ8_9BACI|nr:hypothetical protein [Metabacillus lacus]MRX71555.1 hypothetical protein [Metabacillus lacus]